MSLNLPLQNLLQNTQHMCSFCVLGRPCQISSAVLIRPIRAFCPWNLAWIWHLSLIWTNHNKSLSFSCFISWETAYFGIFVKKLALFLEITSARRGTSLRTALCVWSWGFCTSRTSLIKKFSRQAVCYQRKKIDCILFMDPLSRLIFPMFSQSSTVSPIYISWLALETKVEIELSNKSNVI